MAQPFKIDNLNIQQTITVQGKEAVIRDVNMQTGTINFFGTKKATVNLAFAFTKKPRITLTLLDTSTINPYTTGVELDKFTINFNNNWTGAIEWMAIER